MTTIQKVIKYLAIAFAIFLTVSIVSGILGALGVITGLQNVKQYIKEDMQGTTYDAEIESLDIDLAAANLKIQNGETFSVETDNEYITHRQKDGKVIVEEKKHNWFGGSDGGTLVITIPEDHKLQEIEIDAGAGNIEIACAEVRNLDLDMGVGELKLISRLNGNSDIDFGVGEANIILIGESEDYRIRMSKGIGRATLDGKDMGNDEWYGNGSNMIEMDGGVGEIAIEFQSEIKQGPI